MLVMRRRGWRWLSASFLLLLAPLAWALPEQVVVIANRSVPESVELARYYVEQRGIPTNNLCLLDLPRGETISRAEYESRLRDPLLMFLREHGLAEQKARKAAEVGKHETSWDTIDASVRYLVSIYGVPLRIGDTKSSIGARLADKIRKPQYKNEAAVDSELTLLLHPPYDIAGAVINPIADLHAMAQLVVPAYYLLVATRLDGPNAESVRRMVDQVIEAERYGLQGRCYFDARGARGEYYLGDYWLQEAFYRFKREGYESLLNRESEMWPETFPMNDVGVYLGWYGENMEGPFTRDDFRFMPGAVAYHIHSGSATTLRSTQKRWAGPLVARGADATMGAVSEPYLALTPNLRIFADRLCSGYAFGDAAYMALSHVSWQVTVVGDPIYRPFRYTLDQQLEHLEEDERYDLMPWALVRKANQLIAEGRQKVAVKLLRREMALRDSLVIREKLADLHAANEEYALAGRQYETILSRTEDASTAMRVGARWLLILRLLGQEERADQLEAELREHWAGAVELPWLDTARP